MAYREFENLSWVSRIDAQNTNYNYFTVDKIKDMPRKWLSTLPMFEYAHIMTMITAIRTGGDPEKYVEILHKQRLAPILTCWYNKLAEFRFHRALHLRNYNELRAKITDDSISEEIRKIKKCAICTRKQIREVCAQFEAEQLGNNPTQTP